ncbi:Protein turtle B [Liparis tanakae]|uniref:Protein turtle B n=1 Tax=Liparis tanakae TaxID=230148 RepID=A0A4Z2FYK8_9TELE|nr:Protein turtle B [Liparis tanakae]
MRRYNEARSTGAAGGARPEVRGKVGGAAELECVFPPSEPTTGEPSASLHVVEWIQRGLDIPVLIRFGAYAPRLHPQYEAVVEKAANAIFVPDVGSPKVLNMSLYQNIQVRWLLREQQVQHGNAHDSEAVGKVCVSPPRARGGDRVSRDAALLRAVGSPHNRPPDKKRETSDTGRTGAADWRGERVDAASGAAREPLPGNQEIPVPFQHNNNNNNNYSLALLRTPEGDDERCRASLVRDTDLRLEDLRLQDGGVYECRILSLDQATDELQNATWTRLSVTAPPTFTETPPPALEALVGIASASRCICFSVLHHVTER